MCGNHRELDGRDVKHGQGDVLWRVLQAERGAIAIVYDAIHRREQFLDIFGNIGWSKKGK